MKKLFYLHLLAFGILNTSILCAGPFEDHPWFKAVTGSWTGEGELVSSDGKSIQTREVWKGQSNDDGTFSIIGDRESGGDTKAFNWVFYHNPATDLFECEYIHTGMENPIRLEVSLTDEIVTLRAPVGNSNGEITITKAIVGKTLKGTVLVKDGSGTEALKGTVTHTRAKE